MFFFCLSINDKCTKEQNSVAFQRILLQNWNSGGDSLEKFPFKAHSHSAKLPLNLAWNCWDVHLSPWAVETLVKQWWNTGEILVKH